MHAVKILTYDIFLINKIFLGLKCVNYTYYLKINKKNCYWNVYFFMIFVIKIQKDQIITAFC